MKIQFNIFVFVSSVLQSVEILTFKHFNIQLYEKVKNMVFYGLHSGFF